MNRKYSIYCNNLKVKITNKSNNNKNHNKNSNKNKNYNNLQTQ